jgi:hypothetical protein
VADHALIPSAADTSAAIEALPAQQRSEARRRALDWSPEVLESMRDLSKYAEKEAVRVSAGRVVLQVAALMSTTNLPRDVVKEKFELTIDLMREFVPEHQWAEFARRLSPIWSDV